MTRITRLTLAMLMGAVILGAADPPKRTPKGESELVGTWKLVSAVYGGKESKITETSVTLKHITPAQYMWLSYKKGTDVIYRGSGGSYTLNGEDYTELHEYGLTASAVKTGANVFKCKLAGNQWYHSGKLASGLTIDEVWERIEKR